MVFQNYALYPHMSVYDNIAFSLKLRHAARGLIRERVTMGGVVAVMKKGELQQRPARGALSRRTLLAPDEGARGRPRRGARRHGLAPLLRSRVGRAAELSSLRAERLLPTRVYRFYRGGALIGRLRGESEEDGSSPEDWVGSVTEASNPGRDEPEAGLSRLADGRLLREVVEAHPEGWLGATHVEHFGASTGLLVKLLDAAERLPVHAHPDDAFAEAWLGSRFGKTEAWVIVDTRAAEAEVWVGLRESAEPDAYRGWIEAQDAGRLLGSLNCVAVRPGDVVFVPAGVPHAIGPGVLMVELQQPTDFSLVCEWDGFPIDASDAHLGLGWNRALAALDLRAHEPVRGLPDDARRFFWVDDEPSPAGPFAVLVVLEGEGEIDGRPARGGDCFAVPAAVDRLRVDGSLRVLRCLAPEPPHLDVPVRASRTTRVPGSPP